ncbi:MAG: 30S ribosomal protein S13, partial [Candidatus Alkanophagales archaeon]
GRRVARAIAISAGIDPDATLGKLSDEEIERLKNALESIEKRLPSWMLNRRKDLHTGEDRHVLGSELLMTVREDINLLKKIRCYRGIRHELGLKVRGQRTRSTGRKGPAVGFQRKKKGGGEVRRGGHGRPQEAKEDVRDAEAPLGGDENTGGEGARREVRAEEQA